MKNWLEGYDTKDKVLATVLGLCFASSFVAMGVMIKKNKEEKQNVVNR